MAKLPDEDARYHLDRCIKSGLWVPDANKNPAGETDDVQKEGAQAEGEEEEETYEEVNWIAELRSARNLEWCIYSAGLAVHLRAIEVFNQRGDNETRAIR